LRPFRLMIYHSMIQLILFLSLFSLSCLAGETEIQLGAFAIKANAQQQIKELEERFDNLYIKGIPGHNNQILYTVRTGPYATFAQAEKALARIEALEPGMTVMIMEAGSFKKAAKTTATQSPGTTIGSVMDEEDSSAPSAFQVNSPHQVASQGDTSTTGTASLSSGESPKGESPKKDMKSQGMEKDNATTEVSDQNQLSNNSQAPDDSQESDAVQEEGDSLWGDSRETSSDSQDLWGDPPSSDTAGTGGVSSASAADLEKMAEFKEEMDELKAQVQSLLDAEEIRSELTESKEEKEAKEEAILDAAGRNYTLMEKGKVGVEYSIGYTHYDFDTIKELNIIEHNSNHNISNTFTVEFPLRDNLTLSTSIPYIYEYDEVGSSSSKHVSDFGDVSIGANFQPIKSGGRWPSIIIGTTLTCPMGRNPYEVNPETELSTGSGGYSLGTSLSVSKAIDPLMAYGTLSYSYKHPIKNLDYKIGSYTLERYDRGDTVGFSLGLGYSLSYITSLSLGYSYSYSFESKRFYKEASPVTYRTNSSSSISIGTSWRLSQKMRVSMSLGMGLGNSNYYSLSLRFPFEFNL